MKKIVLFAALFLFVFTATAFAAEPAGDTEPADIDVLSLINKANPLANDYAPLKLQDIAKLVRSSKAQMLLRPEAAEAYLAMYEAMVAEGVPAPYAVSGYRTYDYQSGLYNNKVSYYTGQGLSLDAARTKAATVVAVPGTSEHQTGLAIDVSADGSLASAFSTTKAGKWLYENSWKYGFILRYAEDKTDITGIIYEPWHFRYVGLPHAKIIFENGWCLEEYIEFLANGVTLHTEIDGVTYQVKEGSVTVVSTPLLMEE